MNTIKLVVVNENILGYIQLEFPSSIHILKGSILRGANRTDGNISLYGQEIVRLATEQDFNDFNVEFESYKKDPDYIYEKETNLQAIICGKALFLQEIKNSLTIHFKGTKYDKANIVDQRIEQLLKIHCKWLYYAILIYDYKTIADKIYKYQTDMELSGSNVF